MLNRKWQKFKWKKRHFISSCLHNISKNEQSSSLMHVGQRGKYIFQNLETQCCICIFFFLYSFFKSHSNTHSSLLCSDYKSRESGPDERKSDFICTRRMEEMEKKKKKIIRSLDTCSKAHMVFEHTKTWI